MEIVRGMQGEGLGSRFRKVNAEMKHWTAYGVEGNIQKYRMAFDANISLHDLADSYFVPLKTCVTHTNLSAVMCAYPAINGTPSCANEWMNDKVLRQMWSFDGVIESDCGALSNIVSAIPLCFVCHRHTLHLTQPIVCRRNAFTTHLMVRVRPLRPCVELATSSATVSTSSTCRHRLIMAISMVRMSAKPHDGF